MSIPEAKLLDEIQTKVSRIFLLAIHSHLYSFALRFLFLQTHATSYSFYSWVTVHCKGERRKTWQKTIPPLPNGLRNSHRSLRSEISQDYASTKLYVHEFGFCTVRGKTFNPAAVSVLWRRLFSTTEGNHKVDLNYFAYYPWAKLVVNIEKRVNWG